MTETRLPDSIDAIVAALTAAGLTVWDGPIISGDYGDAVYIGFDGDYSENGSGEHAGSTVQTWSSIGRKVRDEDLTITCSVVTLTGDDAPSWKAARDACFAILQTVGVALRADPSLGLPPPSVAELQQGGYFQEVGPEGMQARIVFTIHHKTRV